MHALADSVQAHLQRMLNTRQGNASTALDYGVPDLTELGRGFPQSARDLEEMIRSCIEKYEPRLRDVTARFSETQNEVLVLSFEVTGRLVTPEGEAGVWFETRVDTDGRVEVRG